MSELKDPWGPAQPMLERMLAEGRAAEQAMLAAGTSSGMSWSDAIQAALDALGRSGKPGASQENPSQDVPE